MSDRIGASLLRFEDERLLCGAGRFVADIDAPHGLHAVMVRSPHAHADIVWTDLTAARAMPGVVAAYDGADMANDKVGPIRALWPVGEEVPRFAIARDKARHVGDIVAVIVAETPTAALDAAEHVVVQWRERAAMADARAAMAPDAERIHDTLANNIAFRVQRGDVDRIEDALARSAHVVTLDLVNNRLAGAAMEPRAALALPDGRRTTLFSSTQVPHHMRRLVTEQLHIGESDLRVVAPDVGGGFGYKGKAYAEDAIVVWLARRLGRPVRWTSSRSEAFCADLQARDHITMARLGLDADGRFTALDVRTIANLGSYMSTFGAAIPAHIYSALLNSIYRTPCVCVAVTGVYTNTTPTDAYRGAGRPEACYVVERLVDEAARRLGRDPVALRALNLIQPQSMPYATRTGPTYDCGDFPRMVEGVAGWVGWSQFAARRRDSEKRGKLRGIGVAGYVESSGVAPSGMAAKAGARGGFYESATLRVEPDGGVQLLVGTHSQGQGHVTSFAQIVASRLHVEARDVRLFEGDTDQSPYGVGTFGSRSIAVGGSAVSRACDAVIAKATAVAAHELDVDPARIVFYESGFSAPPDNRVLPFKDIARRAWEPRLGDAFEPGLQATCVYDPPNFAFSNGAHVAEVEIDVETGQIELVSYAAFDDIGVVINPMIAEAQVHGGVAQGVGQALMECCRYDSSGQPITGSFMDYAMPRADDLPFIESLMHEDQPCTHNPLGAKGCGEAGAIAAPAAIANATMDALSRIGVRHLDMPFTPARVWRAIRDARASSTRTAA